MRWAEKWDLDLRRRRRRIGGGGHFDKLFRHSLQLAPHLSLKRREKQGKSAMLDLFFRKSGEELEQGFPNLRKLFGEVSS